MARVVRSNSFARSLMVYVVVAKAQLPLVFVYGRGQRRHAPVPTMRITYDVYVNVNPRRPSPWAPSMNALEQLLDYPFGDAMPAQGETLVMAEGEGSGLAPAVKWIRM